jgi:2-hydroxychromene-2-carboxylate isomerase
MSERTEVTWVYDVISPFAYLSLPHLAQLPPRAQLRTVPVLFAGLLDHFGQRGPAEIPSKRRFTYRFALWRARTLGIPMGSRPSIPSIRSPRCGSSSLPAAVLMLRARC